MPIHLLYQYLKFANDYLETFQLFKNARIFCRIIQLLSTLRVRDCL